MLNRQESIAVLGKHFRQKKIATIKDIMLLINAKNNMGVYRRLKEIDYVSSFSNSGMYYTLKTVTDFNSSGLSFINEVGFSLYGNLKQTLIHLIEESESGKTHQELEIQLKINLKNSLHNALLDLVRSKKISRIAPSNSHVYLYVSVHENRAKKQIGCSSFMTTTLMIGNDLNFLFLRNNFYHVHFLNGMPNNRQSPHL